ncbi:hypothetical protein IJ00_05705 [Calothrix sp. 336/3]|nr:hypothetical protein IJ00_05705 [Calothrix sp. 336/3]
MTGKRWLVRDILFRERRKGKDEILILLHYPLLNFPSIKYCLIVAVFTTIFHFKKWLVEPIDTIFSSGYSQTWIIWITLSIYTAFLGSKAILFCITIYYIIAM